MTASISSSHIINPCPAPEGSEHRIAGDITYASLRLTVDEARRARVDAVGGEHFLVADSYEEHAAAALRILEDRNERQRLAVAGRSRMLSHHDWGRSMQRLDRVIERCLAESGGKSAAAAETPVRRGKAALSRIL